VAVESRTNPRRRRSLSLVTPPVSSPTAFFHCLPASPAAQVMEAANMAKLWSIPAIFMCENNQVRYCCY
jgi:hypothetical protein